MGNYSNYTLLLGVKLNLGQKIIETNPQWKGVEDKATPQYVPSPVSEDEYSKRSDKIKDEKYAYGEKEIVRGHIFPNGQIVENLVFYGALPADW